MPCLGPSESEKNNLYGVRSGPVLPEEEKVQVPFRPQVSFHAMLPRRTELMEENRGPQPRWSALHFRLLAREEAAPGTFFPDDPGPLTPRPAALDII
jgi:hypothetical protein